MVQKLLLLALFATAAHAEPFKSGVKMPSAGHAPQPPTAKTAPAHAAAVPKGELQTRAENYFLKTYTPGSSGMRVMTAKATVGDPTEMPGWPNKQRVTGEVALTIAYKGREQAEKHQFEAVLENGTVTEFTAH